MSLALYPPFLWSQPQKRKRCMRLLERDCYQLSQTGCLWRLGSSVLQMDPKDLSPYSMRAEQAKSEKCSGEVEVDCHDMPCAMCQPGPELAWAKDTTRICKNSCFVLFWILIKAFFKRINHWQKLCFTEPGKWNPSKRNLKQNTSLPVTFLCLLDLRMIGFNYNI